MNQKKDRFLMQAAASGIIKAIAFNATTAALPVVLAAATALTGWIGGGASWMWVIMASSLTFGGASAGVYYLFELVGKRSVEGKLHCNSPRVATDINSGQLCLGINLQSSSLLPVEFEIEQIRTQLNGVYSPSKPFALNLFEIPPQGIAFFTDFPIPLEQPPVGTVLKGSVIAVVKYGTSGNRKYSLSVKSEVHLKFDSSGTINFAWNDLA